MISIIVPVYNVEQYLRRCVESLLNQKTKVPYEIVLIDDGSPDNCGQICDQFQQEYPEKVVAYHKENEGLSSARNYGVLKASGEYIVFVDSDDYVSENYVQDLINLKDEFNADLAVTRVVIHEKDEVSNNEQLFQEFSLTGKDAVLEVYVNERTGWSACGKLFQKQLLKKFPFPDGFYEEMASTYKYLYSCRTVAFGDYHNNYHYLRHDGSITARPLSDAHFRIFDICGEICDFLDLHYTDIEYIKVLLYQNAVLQLLTKLQMTKEQYKGLFMRYRLMFRKGFCDIIKRNNVTNKSKVYAFLLCTNPVLFKTLRKIYKGLYKG